MKIEHGDHSQSATKIARALEILNIPPTVESLAERLSCDGERSSSEMAAAIFARRAEIGSFRTLADLDGVVGLSGPILAGLIDRLTAPPYVFETETLELVQWTHGSSLEIEHPEAFGPIPRRKQGIRIESLRYSPGSRPPRLGVSWAHAAIAAPSFDMGKQFFVKSVLLNLSSSNPPFSVQGSPLATPYKIEVWDGHERIAEETTPYLESPVNRFVRVPVESGTRLRWGLSISLEIFVQGVPAASDHQWRLEIGAVGVELVTRSGLVVSPT